MRTSIPSLTTGAFLTNEGGETGALLSMTSPLQMLHEKRGKISVKKMENARVNIILLRISIPFCFIFSGL